MYVSMYVYIYIYTYVCTRVYFRNVCLACFKCDSHTVIPSCAISRYNNMAQGKVPENHGLWDFGSSIIDIAERSGFH